MPRNDKGRLMNDEISFFSPWDVSAITLSDKLQSAGGFPAGFGIYDAYKTQCLPSLSHF
jgi:hypothetical protein